MQGDVRRVMCERESRRDGSECMAGRGGGEQRQRGRREEAQTYSHPSSTALLNRLKTEEVVARSVQ